MASFQHERRKLELWGGIECTVNRVHDNYFDQVKRSGHDTRRSDLELFSELGVRAVRYPILWERIAPEGLEKADWSWADERLQRLRELKIRPIVGLVHHGSGPRYTSLIDPAFPDQLAEFAAAVAERYPWVDAYTPINEPVTTARFSGLYGFWYPHGRSHETFAQALLNECRATVLAMQAVRRRQPQCELVQTEDLGKIHSTPLLKYQADFENERMWLGFDLLCGRVNRDHSMYQYLLAHGVEQAQLEWFEEHSCPPDIMGFNHYLTSERFIDERLDRYPACGIDDNGQHQYANLEAVRVSAEGLYGPCVLMREAWERYHLPLAFTEVHLACTREEQLRWFVEVWDAAQRLHRSGVDVRAVTAWSLLGAYDWNSLVTCEELHYESGVFDLRGGRPRRTALVKLLKALGKGEEFTHPVLNGEGWWSRDIRFVAPPVRGAATEKERGVIKSARQKSMQPILITGATGTLGRAFARICDQRAIAYRLLSRKDMDIANAASVEKALAEHSPWAVVNTAGYVRVDVAEQEQAACFRENAVGPAILARACRDRGVSLTTFSSDLVFDGEVRRPYVENDDCNPLSFYGDSKLAAEKLVSEIYPHALVIRTSAFFGPWDQHNFVTQSLWALSEGRTVNAGSDCLISPTYVPDLVNAALDLIIDGESGLWHLSNQGAVSWAELARWAAERAGLDGRLVIGCATSELNLPARRPSYSVLGSGKATLLPKLDHALDNFMRSVGSVDEWKRRTNAA